MPCGIVLGCLAAPQTGAQQLYWHNFDARTIEKSALDGSGTEVVVENGLLLPGRIALGEGKIYWSEPGRLLRSNRDGSGTERLFDGADLSFAVDDASGQLYWIDGDRIRRGSLDGSHSEVVLSGLESPRGLVLEPAGGKLYWYEGSTILRAGVDGSDPEVLFPSTALMVSPLVVDPAAGKIYWASGGILTVGVEVRRANLDGSDPELIVSLSLSGFDLLLALDATSGRLYFGRSTGFALYRVGVDGSGLVVVDGGRYDLLSGPLAVDEVHGKVYWRTLVDGLNRADLDGGGREVVVPATVGPGSVAFFVLDPDEGRLYWTSFGRIARAALDGSDVESIHTSTIGLLQDIAVDSRRGRLYWSDVQGRRIRGAALDGSGVHDVVVTDPAEARILAVDPVSGKLYWTELGARRGISRANPDGSDVEQVVDTAPDDAGPGRIAIDGARGHLYWEERVGPSEDRVLRVRRARLDGSDVEVLGATRSYTSLGPFALDPIDDGLFLYLTRSEPYDQRFVARSSLSLSDGEFLFEARVWDLNVDTVRRQLYWIDQQPDAPRSLVRSGLDGSERETVLELEGSSLGFALDLPAADLTATGRFPLAHGPRWRADSFARVDQRVPAAAGVGNLGTASGLVKDVAVDPGSGAVFTIGLGGDGGGQQLYRVDPETGAGTPLPERTGLGPLPLISGLAFDADGRLYGGGLGIYWIDTGSGRAYPLAGLLRVPAVVFGMARSPTGTGFQSTGLLLCRGGLVPYLALHAENGALVPETVVPLVDERGGRVLVDIALTGEGLLAGTTLGARSLLASASGATPEESARLIGETVRGGAALAPERLREQATAAMEALSDLKPSLLTSELVLVESVVESGVPLARLSHGAPLDGVLLGLGPPAPPRSEAAASR